MSISEAFAETTTRTQEARPERPSPGPVQAPAATAMTQAVPGWPVRACSAVAADFRGAWLWDAHGVTVSNLWTGRIPNRDRVPGANRALWVTWCAYNHAALAVLVPLLFAAWVLCHPGRLVYAAPIVVPLLTLWLI